MAQTPKGAPCSSRAPSWRPWGFSILLALVAIPLAAQQNLPLLKNVDDHYNHLKSLRCHYVESYAGMGITRFEYGTLTLK